MSATTSSGEHPARVATASRSGPSKAHGTVTDAVHASPEPSTVRCAASRARTSSVTASTVPTSRSGSSSDTITVAKPHTTSTAPASASRASSTRPSARPDAGSATPIRKARSPRGRTSPSGMERVMHAPVRPRRSPRPPWPDGPRSAIATAPWVSPWMHSVSTHKVSTLPSTATAAPRARQTACAAASSGSLRVAPATLRSTRVPSGRYARSQKPSSRRHHAVAQHHRHGATTRRQHHRGTLSVVVPYRVAEGLVDRAALGDLLVERPVCLDGLDRGAGGAAHPVERAQLLVQRGAELVRGRSQSGGGRSRPDRGRRGGPRPGPNAPGPPPRSSPWTRRRRCGRRRRYERSSPERGAQRSVSNPCASDASPTSALRSIVRLGDTWLSRPRGDPRRCRRGTPRAGCGASARVPRR